MTTPSPQAGPFAPRPEPPYWAVVFASTRRSATGDTTDDGYAAAGQEMMARAATYDGYLGIESARGADGFGITVSYWSSQEALLAWRDDAVHALTRDAGRERWYDHYELRVARVERAYGWDVADRFADRFAD